MKDGIHPDYHEIKVVMNNGTEFMTCSCWGKPGDVMKLDVDPTTHAAWNPNASQNFSKAGQVEKFKNKFGNLATFSTKKKPAEAASE